MRDIVLCLAFAFSIMLAIRKPHVGVLVWAWVAFMNPHLEAYGFAHSLPFNFIVAMVTIGAWLISAENKRLPVDGQIVVMLLFAAWFSLTTLTAYDRAWSSNFWDKNLKSMVFVIMYAMMFNTRERLHAFFLVAAVCICFYSIKGGLFTVLTAGQNTVIGPSDTVIGDNNHLALAMIITVPILNYLRLNSAHPWMRLALAGAMGLSLVAVLGTYSRGGFLALAAILAFLWLKSRRKLATLALALIVVVPAYQFMPDKYGDRLSTIQSADKDESFQGRLNSWTAAFNNSLVSPLGAGFNGVQLPGIYYRYISPEYTARAAHSIYFQVLGDHGFGGLALYLLLGLLAWRNGQRTIALTHDRPELTWARDLAAMLQVSMIGFYVGGAALSMAYYDLFLAILTTQSILPRVVKRELAELPIGSGRTGDNSHNSPLLPHGAHAR